MYLNLDELENEIQCLNDKMYIEKKKMREQAYNLYCYTKIRLDQHTKDSVDESNSMFIHMENCLFNTSKSIRELSNLLGVMEQILRQKKDLEGGTVNVPTSDVKSKSHKAYIN